MRNMELGRRALTERGLMRRTWRKLGAVLLFALPASYWSLVLGDLYYYSQVQGWQTHFARYVFSFVRWYLIGQGLWEPTAACLMFACVVYPWRRLPNDNKINTTARDEGVWPPPPTG
jgi:hypothetical protein